MKSPKKGGTNIGNRQSDRQLVLALVLVLFPVLVLRACTCAYRGCAAGCVVLVFVSACFHTFSYFPALVHTCGYVFILVRTFSKFLGLVREGP